MANTITPAHISFSIDGKEVSITDAALHIELSNGSVYRECVLDNGKKGYLLSKGAEISRAGDIKIETMRTGDKKGDAAIKALEDAHKATHKSDDPASYTKPIAFSVATFGGKTFANVTFEGFVKEYQELDPVGTEPPKQEAEVELYDPMTLQISN